MSKTVNPEWQAAFELDRNVQVGTAIEVRWTANYREFRTAGTVVKVNAKSLRVALRDGIKCGDAVYPAGREIVVPRVLSPQWTYKNGAFAPSAPVAQARPGMSHEVVECFLWRRDDGREASVHGAVPWTSPAEKARWTRVSVGWTTFNPLTNQYGTGRPPFTNKDAAERFAASLGQPSRIGIGD